VLWLHIPLQFCNPLLPFQLIHHLLASHNHVTKDLEPFKGLLPAFTSRSVLSFKLLLLLLLL
jgi:hypothetical protein